ncbi:MAG: hypothetical protein ACC612_11385 [Methanomethylovorans sp.]|uniref:hypothetical protein n=1 Tax=Methanomethylovorans sp. TaxID=2758717 RepID=UPI0035309BE7
MGNRQVEKLHNTKRTPNKGSDSITLHDACPPPVFAFILAFLTVVGIGAVILEDMGNIPIEAHNSTIIDKQIEPTLIGYSYYFVLYENNTRIVLDVTQEEYFTHFKGEWFNYTTPRGSIDA